MKEIGDAEYRRALAYIRESCAFFGHDTSHLTDEELAENIVRFSKLVGSYGITAEQVLENCAALSRALQEQP